MFIYLLNRTLRTKLAEEIAELAELHKGFMPHLTIVQVGDREDSSLYVRMKQQAAAKVYILYLYFFWVLLVNMLYNF